MVLINIPESSAQAVFCLPKAQCETEDESQNAEDARQTVTEHRAVDEHEEHEEGGSPRGDGNG
jgi:hypothetical protein